MHGLHVGIVVFVGYLVCRKKKDLGEDGRRKSRSKMKSRRKRRSTEPEEEKTEG